MVRMRREDITSARGTIFCAVLLVLAVSCDERAPGFRMAALSSTPVWVAPTARPSTAIAWGDWDCDGYPDLAVANTGQPNEVYRNTLGDGAGPGLELAWTDNPDGETLALAWADCDGDGDLDLAVGGRERLRVYRNEPCGTLTQLWGTSGVLNVQALAWGHLDDDPYPDLAVAVSDSTNKVYVGNGACKTADTWIAPVHNDLTWAVAWGDFNGDGRGRAFDNIFTERLWRTVKYENIYINDYDAVPEVYDGLDRYFAFYNDERLHQSLDYATPREIHFGAVA